MMHDDNDGRRCLQDERHEGDAAAVDADSASLSVDIEYLTAELRDAGQQQQQHDTATASYQHLSSNLIRTSLSVLKLEKQTRLQKVQVYVVQCGMVRCLFLCIANTLSMITDCTMLSVLCATQVCQWIEFHRNVNFWEKFPTF